MNIRRQSAFSALAFFSFLFPHVAAARPEQPPASISANSVEGYWLVQAHDGIFYVGDCAHPPKAAQVNYPDEKGLAGKTCGWLVGLDYGSDEAIPKDWRGDTECGLRVFYDFTKPKPQSRMGGRVLDPRSGSIYSGTLWSPAKNILKMRGYLGSSLFGETQTWTRFAYPEQIAGQCRMPVASTLP